MKTRKATATAGVSDYGDVSSTMINRLHRMVRHGFRPVSKPSKLPAKGGGGKTWLGYSAASGQDQDLHLRRRSVRPARGPGRDARGRHPKLARPPSGLAPAGHYPLRPARNNAWACVPPTRFRGSTRRRQLQWRRSGLAGRCSGGLRRRRRDLVKDLLLGRL
jgi:hypothetical protein